MAQKVEILLLDDLDGGKADETVTFALDGVSYEIDLTEANADKLRAVLGQYVEKGRRVGGRAQRGRGRGPARSGSAGGADTAEIRTWARDNGYEVSDRGRVPLAIKEAYGKAHG